MKDVTDEYRYMIEGFECDFNLAVEGDDILDTLQHLIETKNENMLKDIDLLQKLSYLLRNGKVKIVECDNGESFTNL